MPVLVVPPMPPCGGPVLERVLREVVLRRSFGDGVRRAGEVRGELRGLCFYVVWVCGGEKREKKELSVKGDTEMEERDGREDDTDGEGDENKQGRGGRKQARRKSEDGWVDR